MSHELSFVVSGSRFRTSTNANAAPRAQTKDSYLVEVRETKDSREEIARVIEFR